MARLANCYFASASCFELPSGYTYAIRDTVASKSDASEPPAREDGRLRETTSIPGLVEPGDGVGEATLATEHVLEGPGEVPVPQQELGVSVNVGGKGLVKSDEILVTTPGVSELARRSPAHQALDGVDETLLSAIIVLVPLNTDANVAACRAGGEKLSKVCSSTEKLGHASSATQKFGHVASDLVEIVDHTVDSIGDT